MAVLNQPQLPPRHQLRDDIVRASLIALGYFLSARLSLAFVTQPEGLAVIWPPSGLLLAALLLSAPRSWPVTLVTVAIAIVLANLAVDNSLAVSFGFALANCAESLMAAWLLMRVLGTPITLNRLYDVLGLFGLAVVAGNAISALLGATIPTLAFGTPFWDSWRVWWTADGLGMLVVGSVALAWANHPPPWRNQRVARVAECLALFSTLALLALFIFGSQPAAGNFRLPYPIFPLLLWAALRFGIRGGTSAMLLLAGIVIWNTLQGSGPFVSVGSTATHPVLEAQSFLVIAWLVTLMAAAIMAERQRAQVALQLANDSLERRVTARTAALVRAEAAQRRSTERLRALHTIDQAILAAQPLPTIAQAVLGQLRLLIPCEHISVVVFDFPATSATVVASNHQRESSAALSYPLEPQQLNELARDELQIVEDTDKLPNQPRIIELLQTSELRAYLSLALKSGSELIGMLIVGRNQPGGFAPVQIEIVRELADQLAIAIKHSRLNSSEQQVRQNADILRAANLALAQTLELELVLTTLLDHLARLIPYDSANVMLHESGTRLVMHTLRGYERWTNPELVRAISFDIDTHPYCGLMQASGASILIPDTHLDAAWQALPGTEHVRSWLGVPLIVGGTMIGLYAVDKTEAQGFTKEQQALAEAFASQAAIAIQNARLFAEVRAGRERLQQLSSRLVEVQEAERRHLARELHDEIGQALTGLSLALTIGSRSTFETLRARMANAQRQINDLTAQIRGLSLDLRPAMLDDLGLLPALLWFFKRYTIQTGVQVIFKHTMVEQRFTTNIEITAYRFIQEALTNVARHAGVAEVIVRVWANDEILGIQVEDRGTGFDPALALAAYRSSGLSGMRERVLLLGGYCTIESAPYSGTCLTAELPLTERIERRREQR